MWDLAGSLVVIGVLAGALIAWRVPDETGWYPNWFLGTGSVLAVLAGLAVGWQQSVLLAWLGLALAGLLVLGAATGRTYAVAAAAALMAAVGELLAWELLLLALIPITGWLWSRGVRKGLWWFSLIPIVIILLWLLL